MQGDLPSTVGYTSQHASQPGSERGDEQEPRSSACTWPSAMQQKTEVIKTMCGQNPFPINHRSTQWSWYLKTIHLLISTQQTLMTPC